MHIGICDDNTLYSRFLLEKVQDYLKKQPNADIDSFFIEPIDAESLQQKIHNKCIDYNVIIMDIEMGHYNGIELAKSINEIAGHITSIIFISSHLHFATEVYDTRHLYFVLKSEVDIRLPKALHSAFSHYHSIQKNKITIKYHGLETILLSEQITYIEVFGRYLHIHCNGEVYKCIGRLKTMETQVPLSFCRCHKSILVNMNYMLHLNHSSCELLTGEVLPVSQTFLPQFRKKYLSLISDL